MRTGATVGLVLLLAFSHVTLSQPVADPCAPTAQTSAVRYLAMHSGLISSGCYGEENDAAPLSVAILADVKAAIDLQENDGDPASAETFAERRANLDSMLTRIEGSLVGGMGDMSGVWRSYATIVLRELRSVKAEIGNNQSIARATDWQMDSDLAFFEGDVTGQFLISYSDDIKAVCNDNSFDDACQRALNSAGQLVRHVRLVKEVLDIDVRKRLSDIHTNIAALDDQWNYYFNDARSQFWWEFIANNALYDPPDDKFAPPPDGQLILLHPRAAVEYVEGGLSVESAYHLAGIVELIGYNRLRWQKGGPYSDWPLGISAVASWLPAAPGDDWGYGLMLHVKNDYSIGAIRRDTGAGDETTWIFSIDLNKLFLGKSAEAKKLFRGE